ncbi:helix-turn-helix transcriptional regulator [Marinobacter salarius]|uniref:helix-turn-helix transcriptional regulator n=1 Tax=Marinobacter salarius TaxID=1420917 RepID=UPI0018F10BEA|nr:helix-turn-helix transcriptional regulator [Marinobacter salarius]MBJ7277550.1 helix-turn-helix transcriptional regulator [Marinobacter salarius]
MNTTIRTISRHDFLTTSEVADYLRLKQRKVYELVREQQIPCTKVTGKLLFPRQAIDVWIMSHLEGDAGSGAAIAPILAGSNDPLLEWTVREAGTDLALLCHGSGDGVKRLLDGRAMLVGLHLTDPETGAGNDPLRCGLGGLRDLVMIHWAKRRQGLLLRPGNPKGIENLKDLFSGRVRVVRRQPGAGADSVLTWLLERERLDAGKLTTTRHPALGEDDLALEVREGRADCGLGVETAALRHGLEFIPLHTEAFDLAMRRRSYFEPQFQKLLAFCRSDHFRERAESMGGYDIDYLGSIRHNALSVDSSPLVLARLAALAMLH